MFASSVSASKRGLLLSLVQVHSVFHLRRLHSSSNVDFSIEKHFNKLISEESPSASALAVVIPGSAVIRCSSSVI